LIIAWTLGTDVSQAKFSRNSSTVTFSVILSVRDRASLIDVLNETNGCNNVENIDFFLELYQHVSGIIMPIIRIQMW
jgi:hypothetical protein